MFRLFIVLSLLLSAPLLLAQRRPATGGRTPGAELSVRVVYENGRPAGEQLRVQLTTSSGMPTGDNYTDSRGEARFSAVRAGGYRVRITGIGIEDYTSDTFVIDSLDMSSFQMVTVKRSPDAIAAEKASGPPISAAELNVPAKARREFDKGRELLAKDKKDEALVHFQKAIEIYPQYAGAFDAIGTVESDTSMSGAKEYFLKALAADKQFRPAYTHLAKAYLAESDFAEAERLMNVAIPMDPLSAEDMFLLAYAQVKQEKYDLAIKTAERTHQLEHRNFALVHFVAAECFAKTGRPAEAAAHYELYLREAPLGPSAEIAKVNLKAMQDQATPK